jgi:hypothetical protein
MGTRKEVGAAHSHYHCLYKQHSLLPAYLTLLLPIQSTLGPTGFYLLSPILPYGCSVCTSLIHIPNGLLSIQCWIRCYSFPYRSPILPYRGTSQHDAINETMNKGIENMQAILSKRRLV